MLKKKKEKPKKKIEKLKISREKKKREQKAPNINRERDIANLRATWTTCRQCNSVCGHVLWFLYRKKDGLRRVTVIFFLG